MLRTTVVGSWPVASDHQERMQAYAAGQLAPEQVEPLLQDVARVAIEQQQACGLDEYTGGETWTDSFVLHFPKILAGLAPTANRHAWDGRGSYRQDGPLRAPDGLGIAAAYRRESALAPAIAKVNIPGPSEITMMIETEAARATLWPAAIALIRAEIEACAAAGAREVQLDLPHVSMGLVNNEWQTDEAVPLIAQLFDGLAGFRRSLHFCYGDFGARTWTRNREFHPLLPTIQKLDGIVDRVVLEFSLPEQWAERALLADIPDSIEIAAGIVDVKSPTIEASNSLAEKIEELLRYVPAERLLICPSCGLGRRDTALAIGKVTQMVQAVASVNGKRQTTSA